MLAEGKRVSEYGIQLGVSFSWEEAAVLAHAVHPDRLQLWKVADVSICVLLEKKSWAWKVLLASKNRHLLWV